jgi:hypothetical protein
MDKALETDWYYRNGTHAGPIENANEVKASLSLHQLEFILEVRYAWAGCAVDNFYLSYTIQGDVNHEGFVNVLDLNRMGKAYGSSPGLPNWDVYCDINDDKIIDKYDLEIVSKNYGQG